MWDMETYCLDENQISAITSEEDYVDKKMSKYAQFTLLAEDMKKPETSQSRRLR